MAKKTKSFDQFIQLREARIYISLEPYQDDEVKTDGKSRCKRRRQILIGATHDEEEMRLLRHFATFHMTQKWSLPACVSVGNKSFFRDPVQTVFLDFSLYFL